MKDLKEADFKTEIEDFSGVVLIDFWAPWCAPCRMVTPLLEELYADYGDNDRVKIVKVNTDQEQSLAARFSIRGIPTVKVFSDGRAVDQFVGAAPKDTYRDLIEKHL